MNKILIRAALLAVTIVSGLAAETGREIMQRVVDGQRVESSAMDILMTLIGPGGERSTRRLQTLVLDDEGLVKTITLFMEPASVRNTRFLSVENESRGDDQWIYLPALRKVKRIAAGKRSGSFMGSDFTYADMSYSTGSLDESDHTLVREERYEGFDCFVVESIRKSGSDSTYGKTISWVDKETWLTVRVEFFSLDGTAKVKELSSGEIRRVQERWNAGRISMVTVATGHTTVLEFLQVKYDIPMNPAYFTVNFLETGRAQ